MPETPRVVIAMMSHETNTFSPVVTDLDRFAGGRPQPLAGPTAVDTYRGTASCLGGYIAVCDARGITPHCAIAANAPPSGPVENEAYEHMAAAIVEAAAECDVLLLDLHGAMVTRQYDDGEGELLRRLRAAHPELPIAVALDMHANITEQMVANCTLLAGYHTYPHVDMDSTAHRAGELMFAALDGACRPVMRWGNAPMLPHVMRQGTDDAPNQALQARAAEIEQTPHTLVSLFTGFPHADIRDAGLSVVVVTDADAETAQQHTDELLDQAWADRARFVYQPEALSDSLERARQAAAAPGEGPVLLLDHYDNTASGGTMDTTDVLAAILKEGLEDVAVFGFYDPAAVQAAQEAGIGAEVRVELGGKLAMPALARQSTPLVIEGTVKLLSDGQFPATVAMSRGLTMNMGHSAVLRLPGAVDIVIVSRHIEPFDPGCFHSVGIDPRARRYLMLKSRIHYRVGFRDLVKTVVECAGLGVCTSDYSELTFEKVRRPIYPLDGINADRRQDVG